MPTVNAMKVSSNLNALNNISKMHDVSANNIANVNSNGFKASRAVQTGDSVQISVEAREAAKNSLGEEMSTTDVGQDMVQMSVNQHSLEANVKAIQTQSEMEKALMEIKKPE